MTIAAAINGRLYYTWEAVGVAARETSPVPPLLRASYRPRRFSHLIYVNLRVIAYPTHPANHCNLLGSLLCVLLCYCPEDDPSGDKLLLFLNFSFFQIINSSCYLKNSNLEFRILPTNVELSVKLLIEYSNFHLLTFHYLFIYSIIDWQPIDEHRRRNDRYWKEKDKRK